MTGRLEKTEHYVRDFNSKQAHDWASVVQKLKYEGRKDMFYHQILSRFLPLWRISSPPFSPAPANFNEDNIPLDEMLLILGATPN